MTHPRRAQAIRGNESSFDNIVLLHMPAAASSSQSATTRSAQFPSAGVPSAAAPTVSAASGVLKKADEPVAAAAAACAAPVAKVAAWRPKWKTVPAPQVESV